MEGRGASELILGWWLAMDSLAEYIVSVGGRHRKVRLLEVNQKNTASIELDGRTVEVVFSEWSGLEKQTSISVNGETHRIKLTKNDRLLAFNVKVDGRPFVLQLEAKRRGLNSTPPIATVPVSPLLKKEKIAAQKSGAVTSLMPGKVVLLKVKMGDKVKAGDPLCVLEAMKMENEIVAPREGTITQVRVEQDSIVDKGDVLVIIE